MRCHRQEAWPDADFELRCIRVGIEPLGAGCSVAVLWEHVPGLTFQLADAAKRLVGPA